MHFSYECKYDAIVLCNSESEEDCEFIINHACEAIEKYSESNHEVSMVVWCMSGHIGDEI